MRFVYARLKQVAEFRSKEILMGLSLVAVLFSVWSHSSTEATPRLGRLTSAQPKPAALPSSASKPVEPIDPRTARLKKFLLRLHCPVSSLSAEFIKAADDNHLDWRLLPSISVVESGGGKAYRNNNIFGWANGNHPFSSVSSGIREVAYKLGRGSRYRNHDLAGKLRVYNPNEDYAAAVLSLMSRIAPAGDFHQVAYERD